jgi:DNA helicase-2/ATP-dependent DNA helicase PcrA
LVHDTIEDIHNEIIQGNLGDVTNESIRLAFRSNYEGMVAIGMQSLSIQEQGDALDQILDYFNQNYGIFPDICECEREVSIEKPRYVLKGKIDLLVRSNNEYKIFDFKTEKKPDDFIPKRYSRQLIPRKIINIDSSEYRLSCYTPRKHGQKQSILI